ncbi:glutathione hydrolase 1 proenzyme-like isoform X2 [Watersipora subatra]|uniref:glutathione hydrolase 1 proenzyme-like isoform X2 n=1 Tax=Watersipora subatra TaxID=2589382 RepID=UPI00355C4D4C
MDDGTDQDQIIQNDSLAQKDEVDEAAHCSREGQSANTSLTGQTDSRDVNGVRVVIGTGVLVAILSAVALVTSYGVGESEVKLTGLVSTDSEVCAEMGADILRKGGSAVDSIVTTVLCNGLVNMQSSGIGGDGFIMIRDHKHNRSIAIDFRASAPMAATPDMYHNSSQLQYGPLAVAVPGLVAGLAKAHTYHGKLEWKTLVKPVAELARDGFPLTKALSTSLDNGREGLKSYLNTSDQTLYSMLVNPATGLSREVGTILKRADYADALEMIAQDPKLFYDSSISEDIMNSLGGVMAAEDLVSYKARFSPVLKISYHESLLETVGPPAGGVILFHMLKILEGYNFTAADSESDLMYHRMVEAMKFGFAAFPGNVDFKTYVESYNFTDTLLQSGHCAEIRDRITDKVTHGIEYYDPIYSASSPAGTSAASAIDQNELFVSTISTLGDVFGSGLVSKKYGIVLNNIMAAFDYNFTGITPTFPVNKDNMVKGGRRPRSNMSPTIFYNQEFRCGTRGAVGASSGLRIIPSILQYILDILSFEKSAEESIKKRRLSHHLMPNNILYYEENFPEKIVQALQAREHTMVMADPLGVISSGYKTDKDLFGLGDPRKWGKAVIIQP